MDLTLSNKTKKLPTAEFIFIIILFALYLLPSFSIGATTLLVVLFMYMAYLMLSDKELFSTIPKLIALIFILALIYAWLTNASSISQDLSNRELRRFISKTYQYTTLYFPAILFLRVDKTANVKQKKIFVIIGIILMIYVIFTTWSVLAENPNATREWAGFEENATANVANYYFVYAIPIMIATLSIVLFKSKGFAKCCVVGAILLGILFLVNAQYTLSIIITIIGVLIQIFRNLRSNASKVLFLISMIIAALFIPKILETAMHYIQSEQVNIRLSEIYDFFTGQGADGYNLGGRLGLYGKTIKAFFSSPIIGHRSLPYDGHATFLTVLSDTGLFGGIPFYSMLIFVCKQIKSTMKVSKSQFNAVIIMFVLMGVTNPVHAAYPLGFAAWFLSPLCIKMIYGEVSTNEKTLEN